MQHILNLVKKIFLLSFILFGASNLFSQTQLLKITEDNFKFGLSDTNGVVFIAPKYEYLENVLDNFYLAYSSENTIVYNNYFNQLDEVEKLIYNTDTINFNGEKIIRNKLNENYKIIKRKTINELYEKVWLIVNPKIKVIDQYDESKLIIDFDFYDQTFENKFILLKRDDIYIAYFSDHKMYHLGRNYLIVKDIYQNLYIISNNNGEKKINSSCPEQETLAFPVYGNGDVLEYRDTIITNFRDYEYLKGNSFNIFSVNSRKTFASNYESLKIVFYDNNFQDDFYIHEITQDTILSCSEAVYDIFLVKSNKGWGVINANGKLILKTKYDKVQPVKRNDSLLFGAIYQNQFEMVFDRNGKKISFKPYDVYKSTLFERYNIFYDTILQISNLQIPDSNLIKLLTQVLNNSISTVRNIENRTYTVLDMIYFDINRNGGFIKYIDKINFIYVIKSSDEHHSDKRIYAHSVSFILNDEYYNYVNKDGSLKSKALFEISAEDYIRLFGISEIHMNLENHLQENLNSIVD
jgi:hypothetical protein